VFRHARIGNWPHHWQLKRRIDKAKGLLRNGPLPLAEIALNCGFASQCQVNRMFTDSIGVSLGVWLRIWLR
jgi:AraC family transcriptional regulator